MRRIFALLVTMNLVSGCVVIGANLGASAHKSSQAGRPHGSRTSDTKSVAVGAALGLAVDVLVVALVADSLSGGSSDILASRQAPNP